MERLRTSESCLLESLNAVLIPVTEESLLASMMLTTVRVLSKFCGCANEGTGSGKEHHSRNDTGGVVMGYSMYILIFSSECAPSCVTIINKIESLDFSIYRKRPSAPFEQSVPAYKMRSPSR